MATTFQLSIDCADPGLMCRFWSEALGYAVPPAPDGHATWTAFWRSIGVPEEELADVPDRIDDPDGVGPRLRFQQVPEAKVVKNRLHLDLQVGGGRELPLDVRKPRVLAEVERLKAAGATELSVLEREGLDHFAVVMQDPEGNEFCVV